VLYCVVYLGYRRYIRQSQVHAQVEGLYAFTSALDGSLDTSQLMRVILGQVRDELRAGSVALFLPPSGTEPGVRVRISGQGQLDQSPVGGQSASEWWAPAEAGQPVLLPAGYRRTEQGRGDEPVDGIAVPVPVGYGVTAVLLVTDSLPDIRTFAEEHLRLLQAMANHASVSLANARLVNRLREEAAEKEHLALHDPLTGLPNRRHFHRLLDARLPDGSLGSAAGHAGHMAVMMMDLDRFKEINDALGHDIGDALLREVGERLRRLLAGRGAVARLGGDEFAILVAVASPQDAAAVGHELIRDLEQPIPVGHLMLHPRASIGIALTPDDGRDTSTLLRRADVAMYAAKQTRAGVRIYRATDDQNTPQRLALIGDLREVIERRGIFVVFQPQVDPTTGATIGAEALARWQHPAQGFVAPDVFIPLAEHSGLIRPLTLHVLDTALGNCAAWRRAGHDLQVAVNLSPNTLLDDTLPDLILRLLAEHRLPGSALTLEITESTLMADPEGSLATLNRVHALGIKISIDDFGTGYSSLGRLRELPIHEVKIDKSFVQNAAHDRRDRALVRSTVELGHALDLHVVAEGVEDEDTYAFLALEGCDIVQGYHISKPLPADQFTSWLHSTTTKRTATAAVIEIPPDSRRSRPANGPQPVHAPGAGTITAAR
jgi:diguanylate cyclase (GGDEF)-like protein